MTIRSSDTAASVFKGGTTDPADAQRPEGRRDNRKCEGAELTIDEGPRSLAEPENTDLERRVLAHERVLQALIAHMAESEPEFVARLETAFSGPMRVSRREHDFTDTDAYAERFIRGIRRLNDPPQKVAMQTPDVPQLLPDPVPHIVEQRKIVPTLLQLSLRAGIWELTRDGVFYGHYYQQQPAFEAAHTAARAIVANGGCADILLRGEQSGGSVSSSRPAELK
jgi:hypothetical protein